MVSMDLNIMAKDATPRNNLLSDHFVRALRVLLAWPKVEGWLK